MLANQLTTVLGQIIHFLPRQLLRQAAKVETRDHKVLMFRFKDII